MCAVDCPPKKKITGAQRVTAAGPTAKEKKKERVLVRKKS